MEDREIAISRSVALKAAADLAGRTFRLKGPTAEAAFDYFYAKFCAELGVARSHEGAAYEGMGISAYAEKLAKKVPA